MCSTNKCGFLSGMKYGFIRYVPCVGITHDGDHKRIAATIGREAISSNKFGLLAPFINHNWRTMKLLFGPYSVSILFLIFVPLANTFQITSYDFIFL